MMRNFYFLTVLVGFSLLLTACDKTGSEAAPASGGAKGQGGGPPPSKVAYLEVEPVRVSRTEQLPGRVVSYQVAEIRPQVSGILQSRLFQEGSFVEEGEQLYQIDPERYEADHQMSRATLQNAEARRRNAQRSFTRFEQLLDTDAITRQQYDDARAELDQAEAAVAMAEAEVRMAEINLNYTEVRAPISGYIGPSGVTKGALVTARQERPLAVIRQLDPVYVDLTQPAASSRNLRERLDETLRAKGADGTFTVRLLMDESGELYPSEGTLDATDPAVDLRTGAIRLRSVFPNPDMTLLPGMFVRASIEDLGRAKEIVVPQKSVQIEPNGGKFVWIAAAGDRAEKRPIQTGVAFGSEWVVLEGLEPGDRVIVEGFMNLRPESPLQPRPVENKNEVDS